MTLSGKKITYSTCPVCGSLHIQKKLELKDHMVSGEHFDIWECADCTLRFTQDVPDENSIGPYYQSESYISHSNTKEGTVNRSYHTIRYITLKRKRKLVIKESGKERGKLLDIGCGTGAFLREMRSSGWQVDGVEPDPEARKQAERENEIHIGSPEALKNMQPGIYDVITLWHVLEHVHTLHERMDEIGQLLKPGGTLLIAVPNYTSSDAEYYKESWAAYDVPRHLYHFSPASMKKLFQQHGFTLKRIKSMWFDPYYIALLSEGYMNGKTNYLSAVFHGWQSKLTSFMHPERGSAVIYVCNKP